jgi:hypothetical protein
MVEFLQWLEDNHWYMYKDGRWYTTKEQPYIKGISRKYYTKEELVEIFSTMTPREKALELREKCDGYTCYAEVVVDECIELHFNLETDRNGIGDSFKFWNEVKQEIEKL